MSIKVTHKEQLKEYHSPLDTIKKDVCCAMCEKTLVRTVQIKDIPDQKRYRFTCPDCGGKSFITDFYYKLFLEPVSSQINNITEENGIWVVHLKNVVR